jgi:hypothetical protein
MGETTNNVTMWRLNNILAGWEMAGSSSSMVDGGWIPLKYVTHQRLF